MSERKDSGTSATIYVQLLDEGVFVLRPTEGHRLYGNVFRVLPTSDYDAAVETWQFEPGSKVECLLEDHEGEQLLVAKRQVGN